MREELKRRGGYVTADVIDVSPETLNLEVMLAKFNREHGHDEDEVRFIIRGGYIPPSLLTFPATSIRPQGVKPIHIAIKKLQRFCSGCHLRWFSFQTVTGRA